MPRGPQVLTAQQQQMLMDARTTKLALDKAEAEARAEIEVLLARRLTPLKARLAKIITDSVNNGIPRARINVEVLGVTTPNAYQKWLDMHQGYAHGDAAAAVAPGAPTTSAEPQFAAADIRPAEILGDAAEPEWPLPASLRAHPHAQHFGFVGDPAERVIHVTWQGYESTAVGAPAVLVGVVRYDPTSPTFWRTVSDPQNRETAFGTETGALTFETEQRRGEVPLRAALTEYIDAADLPEFEAPGLDADDDEPEDGF